MKKTLCRGMLLALVINVMGIVQSTTTYYSQTDNDDINTNIFTMEDNDLYSNLELVRDEKSRDTRDRFFKYIQELNQYKFEKLTNTLEELHQQFIADNSYYSSYNDNYHQHPNQFEKNDPKKYLKFFNPEQLTCLISEMDPTVTDIDTLTPEEKAKYMHHWADWIWIFYMKEGSDRLWFFDQMRSLETSDHILNNYEAGKNSARFTIHLAHSFIRSINIYRKCAHKIPITSMISDKYVSQYIFRGIRVDTLNISKSMFPANFQSYAMNTTGVHFVLQFYAPRHVKSKPKQDTVVITMMEYNEEVQQLAQPIAIFDLMNASAYGDNNMTHDPITEKEKEVIFPPFCDYTLKEFEINDIKNEFHRELMVARMWKLAFANGGYGFDANIRLLWVKKVKCLLLYEPLELPFTQSSNNELESNDESWIPTRATIYHNVEFWQAKFPQETHACIRLFATHEDDIANFKILEEFEIDDMILELIKNHLQSNEKIKNQLVGFSNEDYIEAMQALKESIKTTTSKNEGKNVLFWLMHEFYIHIKDYIKNQSNGKGLSQYQLKVYFYSYKLLQDVIKKLKRPWYDEEDFVEELNEEKLILNKSINYCIEWQRTSMVMKKSEEKKLEINDCVSAVKLDSDHQGRFVCEYKDRTYSLDTKFPCQRSNTEKQEKEFGRFCKLS